MTLEQQCNRIRAIELAIAARYSERKIRQPVHLSIGQEAAAVGVCAALGPDDLVIGSHRSHAWYLAKGGSLNGLIAELHGKATGCSRGHGGSMHLVDWSCGFAGSTSIVAGSIPVGVGLAWAKRLRGEPGWVVITFGDAAVEQGVFHEAANFASLHKLKVLFVCENNRQSCYTPIEARQPRRVLACVGMAHMLETVHTSKKATADDIRKGAVAVLRNDKPTLWEIECKRHFEHCGPARERGNPNEAYPEFDAEINEAFRLAEAAPNPEPVGMYAG